AGSTTNQVTVINEILANPAPPVLVQFDDALRPITGGTVNISPTIPGEFNWGTFVSNGASTNVVYDRAQFPTAPGGWRFEPCGNPGEYAPTSTPGGLTAPQNYGVRPHAPFTVTVRSAIAASPARHHVRCGIGYYPTHAEFPDYFIGFVYWHSDQTYNSQHTY